MISGAKIFCQNFGFLQKIKKKGHCAVRGIFVLDFKTFSKKKKKEKQVISLRCASLLQTSCNIDERGADNRSCLRFLAENKNAGFRREIKTLDFTKIQCENAGKNFALFFALIENTARST